MGKTIAQMAGRMKFTENEIAMTQGFAEALHDISNEINQNLSNEDCYRLATKVSWTYKETCSPNEEVKEEDFQEYIKVIMSNIFS